MNFVCLSDTHTYLDQIEIPDGDVLIIAGDTTFRGTTRELTEFNEQVGKLPHKYKLFTPGNHDVGLDIKPEMRNLLTNMKLCIDETVEIEGIKIYLSPYTPEFCGWAFMLYPNEMKAKWDLIPSDIDILVTHGPPFGILDMNQNGEHCGCHHLRNAIVDRVKPKFSIFGHIHENCGQLYNNGTTIFANVSVVDEHYRIVNSPFAFSLDNKPS